MTNPFQAFDISDDQQDQFVETKKENTRKSHKERRQLKKQGTQEPTTTSSGNNAVLQADIPQRVRDDAKVVRNKRQPRQQKGVPAGHPLDRRSGTGRVDRPRKQGGGKGSFGNVKDELNSDKYQKPQQQVLASTEEIQAATVQQQKPEEPQALTLQEYYKNKGVDFSVASSQRTAPVKNTVNAEWLQKEKLTLVETKEDKKKLQTVKQNIPTHTNTRVQLQFGNSELLGFGQQKPVQKAKEEEHHHHDNKEKGHHHHKAKRGPKVVLKEDDFPTL